MASWKQAAHVPALIILQIIFIILFGIFVVYNPDTAVNTHDNKASGSLSVYPMFQDVNVMIFIGFGFLMTFLKKYGYSAVSLNMLLSVISIQWATLVLGFFHLHTDHDTVFANGTTHTEIYPGSGYIYLDLTHSMLNSDFAAATILISFGALIGKTTPLQLIVMVLIEIVLFSVNEVIGRQMIGTVDVGDTIFVHLFGAYFGLSASRVLFEETLLSHPHETSGYHSDLFSMIGTIFLWMFWPSFNAAAAGSEAAQHRALLNTFFSLCACVVTTFALSAFSSSGKKFTMEHIQNATLAGGVAVGAAADMMLQPFGALIVGALAGIISTLGFEFLSPFLAHKLKLHDTCGVHNLHGMPAVFGAITSMIVSAMATEEQYTKKGLTEIFPLTSVDTAGGPITPSQQAVKQLIGFVITLAIAVPGGCITGFILRLVGKFQAVDVEATEEIPDGLNMDGWERQNTTLPRRAYFNDHLFFNSNQTYHEIIDVDKTGKQNKHLVHLA